MILTSMAIVAVAQTSIGAAVTSWATLLLVPVVVALITAGPSWMQAKRRYSDLSDVAYSLKESIGRVEGKVDLINERVESLSEWRTLHDEVHKSKQADTVINIESPRRRRQGQ